MKHVSGVTKHMKDIATKAVSSAVDVNALIQLSAPGFFVQKQSKHTPRENTLIIDNINVDGEMYYILQDIG